MSVAIIISNQMDCAYMDDSQIQLQMKCSQCIAIVMVDCYMLHALSVSDHEGTTEIEHVIEADHTTNRNWADYCIISRSRDKVMIYDTYLQSRLLVESRTAK